MDREVHEEHPDSARKVREKAEIVRHLAKTKVFPRKFETIALMRAAEATRSSG
jgi:hypothetical protein